MNFILQCMILHDKFGKSLELKKLQLKILELVYLYYFLYYIVLLWNIRKRTATTFKCTSLKPQQFEKKIGCIFKECYGNFINFIETGPYK